jgi:hypothetical protein
MQAFVMNSEMQHNIVQQAQKGRKRKAQKESSRRSGSEKEPAKCPKFYSHASQMIQRYKRCEIRMCCT